MTTDIASFLTGVSLVQQYGLPVPEDAASPKTQTGAFVDTQKKEDADIIVKALIDSGAPVKQTADPDNPMAIMASANTFEPISPQLTQIAAILNNAPTKSAATPTGNINIANSLELPIAAEAAKGAATIAKNVERQQAELSTRIASVESMAADLRNAELSRLEAVRTTQRQLTSSLNTEDAVSARKTMNDLAEQNTRALQAIADNEAKIKSGNFFESLGALFRGESLRRIADQASAALASATNAVQQIDTTLARNSTIGSDSAYEQEHVVNEAKVLLTEGTELIKTGKLKGEQLETLTKVLANISAFGKEAAAGFRSAADTQLKLEDQKLQLAQFGMAKEAHQMTMKIQKINLANAIENITAARSEIAAKRLTQEALVTQAQKLGHNVKSVEDFAAFEAANPDVAKTIANSLFNAMGSQTSNPISAVMNAERLNLSGKYAAEIGVRNAISAANKALSLDQEYLKADEKTKAQLLNARANKILKDVQTSVEEDRKAGTKLYQPMPLAKALSKDAGDLPPTLVRALKQISDTNPAAFDKGTSYDRADLILKSFAAEKSPISKEMQTSLLVSYFTESAKYNNSQGLDKFALPLQKEMRDVAPSVYDMAGGVGFLAKKGQSVVDLFRPPAEERKSEQERQASVQNYMDPAFIRHLISQRERAERIKQVTRVTAQLL